MASVIITEVAFEVGYNVAYFYKMIPFVSIGAFIALSLILPLISSLFRNKFRMTQRIRFKKLLGLIFMLSLLLMAIVPVFWLVD
jgi:hypothetical protein